MTIERLLIVGTSHIARESIEKVRKAVSEHDPDIIAVELDRNRLASLMMGKKRQKASLSLISKIGVKGFLFLVLASWMQRKLGQFVKLEPGSDMLEAVRLAKKENKKIALIDQDIQITLSKFSKSLSWGERWHFVVDLFRGLINPKKEFNKLGMDTLDLTKVPTDEIIIKMMSFFEIRYPNLFRVLVTERNSYMARRLYRIMIDNPMSKVVAVVGAGHEKEMTRLVQSLFESNGGITYSQSYNVG